MQHLMFDVDGTLVDSFGFDTRLFVEAVFDVTGCRLDTRWENYPNITDRGILKTFISSQAVAFDLKELEVAVKSLFIEKINNHLATTPAKAKPGAVAFLRYLKNLHNVHLSIATGGWGETAAAKLQSAGFDISGIPLMSSNHHHVRTEIMQKAERHVGTHLPVTYFGDAQWDKAACAELGYDLVIVGDRVEAEQQIVDFSDMETALAWVGL